MAGDAISSLPDSRSATEQIRLTIRALTIVLGGGGAAEVLRRYAPTLFWKLMAILFKNLGKNLGLDMTDFEKAVQSQNAKKLARFVGGISSAMVRLGLTGRLTLMRASVSIVARTAVKLAGCVTAAVATTTAKGTAAGARQSYRSVSHAAQEVIANFRREGASVSPEDAKSIVAEIAGHPQEILQALKDMHQALAAL